MKIASERLGEGAFWLVRKIKFHLAVLFFFQAVHAETELSTVAYAALKKYRENSSKGVLVPEIREIFKGLSDAQRIEAIFSYLVADDTTLEGTPYAMPYISAVPFVTMIGNDPELITDVSTLREMLKAEENPRNFFHLSRLAMALSINQQLDFTKEMSHMLFISGRVSNVPPEMRSLPVGDASEYAYGLIVTNLARLGVVYPKVEDDLPIDQRARLLSKWLRDRHAPRKVSRTVERGGTKKEGVGKSTSTEEKEGINSDNWALIASILLALAGSSIWLKSKLGGKEF